MLNWTGGIGPYQIESTTNLVDWTDLGNPVGGNSMTIAPTNAATFYQVIGQ
jgi:hypothetical protein